MAYKALTRIGLPVMEDREVHKGVVVPVPTGDTVYKEPGDTITKKELTDAGQDDDDIASLLKDKAMEEAGS